MRKYNINTVQVHTTEQLYGKTTSAVQVNSSTGKQVRTTVDATQGWLLSPTLFNGFLRRIMPDALKEHDGNVSVGGRNNTNLRSADDIDALVEEERSGGSAVDNIMDYQSRCRKIDPSYLGSFG